MKKSKSKTSKLRWGRVVAPFLSLHKRIRSFLARRPHRSFRRTRRRDYVRSLNLPGYFAFTSYVFKTISQGRKLLLAAALLHVVATVLAVGWASQDTYSGLSEFLRESGDEFVEGGVSKVGEAGLMLVATVTSNLNGAVTPESQVYAGLLMLLFWLLVVWLLRAHLAGKSVRLRDGVYNSGAPIVSTALVMAVLFVQQLPLLIAIIAYSAGMASGVLSGGVEAMLIWTAIILLGALSLYWSISTFIALVVVTLPGMYPMEAIRTAGDLVVGRRVRIFLRILWMVAVTVVAWAVIMIPIIILDSYIKGVWNAVEWLPIVPISLLIMSSLTLLFGASYIYLLYRKIVEDDAKPA